MPTIIGVQYRPCGKVYFFDPKDTDFSVGEGAIVETAHGLEYGKVTLSNREVPQNQIKGELKSVVRKATEKDEAQHLAIAEKRPSAIREAQQRADKRNLKMKVVDADFAFDNSKVVFYFTADNRVDFRELVKELAATFHMRIELRQIGIRDECKMKGGLGPCGRVCCCNSCLNDFARVSIKMAKTQGLSLNPSKISGLCGRLMCCLKYEDAYYSQTAKFMPKIHSEISTPNGKGRVIDVDMIRQLVTVSVNKNDDETEIAQFTLEQLGITPVYDNNTVAETPVDEGDEDLPTEEEENL